MAEIAHLQSSFAQAASNYEFRMGQVTRQVARHICSVTLSNLLPPSPHICDNACGTGAVTSAVLSTFPDAKISATDIAPPMIEILRAQHAASHRNDIEDDDGGSKNTTVDVHAQIADSTALPFPNATFDAQLMNFGIFFTSDPTQAAREIYRTLKPGATAVVTGWLDSVFFRLTFAVQDVVAPAASLRSLAVFDEWKDPSVLRATLGEAGFDTRLVEVESVPVHAVLDSEPELVRYCVESIRGVLGELWTEEEVGRLRAATEQVVLGERGRDGRRYFEKDAQGRFMVSWTAWVARATK